MLLHSYGYDEITTEPKKRISSLETIEDALRVGLLAGTNPHPKKPRSFKTVQAHRLRAQKLAEEFGSLKIDNISELDLWWWHLQIAQELPEYFEDVDEICNIDLSELRELRELRKKIDLPALKKLREMIWKIQTRRRIRKPIFQRFDFKWRSKLRRQYWKDPDHPLNFFLLENLTSSFYSRYFKGFERHPELDEYDRKQVLQMLRSQKKKRKKRNQKKRYNRLKKEGKAPPVQLIIENPTVEDRQKYKCCIDATTTKDLLKLMEDQPETWVNWLQQERELSRSWIYVHDILRFGFYPKTIPQKSVSYKTMQRHRGMAKLFAELIPPKMYLYQVDEHFLWFLHLEIVGLKKHPKLTENDLNRFRTMIYELQVKTDKSEARRVFSTFDWDWREQKWLRHYKKSKKLDQWLLENKDHYLARDYSLGIRECSSKDSNHNSFWD